MDHILTVQAIRNSIMANSIFISALLLFLSILLGLFEYNIIGDIDIRFLGSTTISVGLVQMSLIGAITIISLYNFVFSVRMLHRSQFLITANTKKREDISQDIYEIMQKTFLTAQNHWMLGIRCLFFLIPSITWLLNPIVFLISTILLTLYLIGWHDLTLFRVQNKRK